MSGRQAAWVSAVLLVAALCWAAPRVATDPDTLSRLAMGRLLWTRHALPASDPFTFSAASVRFGDPEWLGDLVLSALYDRGGEPSLVTFAMVLGALGYVAAFALGTAWGAPALVLVCLLLWTVPVVSPRVVARNDLHLFWLLPSFIACVSSEQRKRAWLVLLLGWVWANTHSSFVLGLPLLIAAQIDKRASWLETARLSAMFCALPLLGPWGLVSVEQLIDHSFHGAIYRRLISEWQTPLSSAGVLAVLPLHVLTLLGIVTLWRAPRTWLRLVMFVMGVGLAYSARRFLPMMTLLIVPAIAAHVAQSLMTSRVGLGALITCTALYVGLGLRSAMHRETPSIFATPHGPAAAARFLAAHAPSGARIANTFDDGPWLTWITAPRLQHYLDPRNNLGAELLERYMTRMIEDPEAFAAEAARLNISLVLLRFDDPRCAPLRSALLSHAAWKLVYWDGHHVVYAKVGAANQQLLQHFGYDRLRASFDLTYLRARLPTNELARLRQTAPPVADLVEAYQYARAGSATDLAQARGLLARAAPQLMYSSEFLRYWASSLTP